MSYGEPIFVAYYFIVHGTLSLMLPLVISKNTSVVLILWIFSLWTVIAFYVFGHTHSIVGLPGMENLQREIIIEAFFIIFIFSVTMVIVLLYYFDLNKYFSLIDPERKMRSNRVLNREFAMKRLNDFHRLNQAVSWGGKLQAIQLVQKLYKDGRQLSKPTPEELEFDEDEAVYAFGQVHGLPQYKVYRILEEEIEEVIFVAHGLTAEQKKTLGRIKSLAAIRRSRQKSIKRQPKKQGGFCACCCQKKKSADATPLTRKESDLSEEIIAITFDHKYNPYKKSNFDDDEHLASESDIPSQDASPPPASRQPPTSSPPPVSNTPPPSSSSPIKKRNKRSRSRFKENV